MYTAARQLGDAHQRARNGGQAKAGTVQGQAMRLRSQLRQFDDDVSSPVTYPGGYFSDKMAALAALLAAGLPIRCVAMSASGQYDTHDNQGGSLTDDLGEASSTLVAFQRDLEARGIADRVVTLVWSEFGRRPEENGNGSGAGTDHGAGGCAFLMGTQVTGEMVGEFPGLANLDEDDNLRYTVDFRSVYCSLIEQWFNRSAAAVVPGASRFARVPLIRS